MKLTHFFMFAGLFFSLSIVALPEKNHLPAPKNVSLDAANPVLFGGNYIVYQNRKIELNEHTFFIDGNMTAAEALKHSYVFRSLNEAVSHLKDGTIDCPMTLYIAPYVYWIDNPDDPAVRTPQGRNEPIGLKVKCNYLTLSGLTENPRNVVLASNRGQMEGAVGNFTMFLFDGDNLSVNNLTMGNYCNVDLDYPLFPSLNRKMRMPAITQAQLAFCTGDRIQAHNVHFISRLNLCPLVGGKRTLFGGCHFESTDDALCSTGLYLNCDFDFYGSKPFYATAETGSVLLNCDFHVCSADRQYLVKAESPVVLVDCRYHADSPVFIGWTQDPTGNVKCYQSNVSLNGTPILVNADRPELTVDMTGKSLMNAYKVEFQGKTIYNTYNLLRGDDDWDPMHVKSFLKEAEENLKENLTNIPVCLKLESTSGEIRTGGKEVVMKAVALRFGGYACDAKQCTWAVTGPDSALVSLEQTDGSRNQVISTSNQDETANVMIKAFTSEGLEASTVLSVSPSLLQAPEFLSMPKLKLGNGGRMNLLYSLDLAGRKDCSFISWYRCSDSKGNNAVLVSVSRLNHPESFYELSGGDIGYYLMAKISSRHVRSLVGKEVVCIYPKRIRKKDVPERNTLETDFRNFPTDYQPRIISGFWTVDGYKPVDTKDYDWEPNPQNSWYYGTGFDAAEGTGLMQANRGARLLYTPLPGTYGDMKLTLDVDPCKQLGQGFGSATGQYMDICIKFDTRTLTGYAVRIIRTTKYHNAVDFVLVKYQNGIVSALSAPVSATCYRAHCHIEVSVRGTLFEAHAVTTASPMKDAKLPNKADLQASVEPSIFGGIGIQHTGSNGPSATMLHSLKVEWK